MSRPRSGGENGRSHQHSFESWRHEVSLCQFEPEIQMQNVQDPDIEGGKNSAKRRFMVHWSPSQSRCA
jgi:hypothetical protein